MVRNKKNPVKRPEEISCRSCAFQLELFVAANSWPRDVSCEVNPWGEIKSYKVYILKFSENRVLLQPVVNNHVSYWNSIPWGILCSIFRHTHVSADPADGKGERVREDITISQGQDMMRATCKSQREGSRQKKKARSKSKRARWKQKR